MCLGNSSHIFLGTKPSVAIFQDGRLKSLWTPQLMNRWLDLIQIWYGCSLGISDDLINFWDESIENKMNGCHSHLKKYGRLKSL